MAKDQEDVARPRGRPRLREPGMPVSTWLRPSDHDRLIQLAKKQDKYVSELVRDLLTSRLR